MDDKLKTMLIDFDELDYGSPDDAPLKNTVAKIEQSFYDEFKKAYIKDYNLTEETLSVNDVRILKLAATTFGIEPETLKVVGE